MTIIAVEEERGNPIQQSLSLLPMRAKDAGLSEYLLIGDNAVIAYGVPRFTRDLDFVIPDREENGWRKFSRRTTSILFMGRPSLPSSRIKAG